MKVKLLFTLIAFLALTLTNLKAQNLLIEDFNYPAGDSLGAHGWTNFSGGTLNVLTVTAPGLTYTGYQGSGIGNAVQVLNSGQDDAKPFTPDSVGSVYCSFMVRVDSARTGDYFFGFFPSTSTTLYTARTYAKDSLGMVSFGISKGSATGGPIVYSAPIYQKGVTYLLVVKYTFNTVSTTDDEMRLYVFTQPLVPPTEPPTATVGPVVGTASDVANIGKIAIRQGSTASSPDVRIDGFRVGTTWTNTLTKINTISTTASNFNLSQNFPNPFNPETNINFSLPKKGFVNLTVYNSLGQVVNNLINADLNEGTYNVNFNGVNLNSGVYFYTLRYNGNDGKNFSDTKKLLLVK